MRKRRARALAATAGALMSGGGRRARGDGGHQAGRHRGASTPKSIVTPGARHLTKVFGSAPTTAECEADYQVACYSPEQLRDAYNLAPVYASGITGKGETIVIVDSYGSPTIQNDLTVFDRTFGLNAPPSFKVVTPLGPIPWTRPPTPTRLAPARPRWTCRRRTPSRPTRTSCWSRTRSMRPRA